MDRNIHTDEFERLLREKSDEFRLYPTKRIWYSIYNDIHPGRKWPSVAMSIILITSLFLIGFLNTSNTNNKAKQQQTLIAAENTTIPGAVFTKAPSSSNEASSAIVKLVLPAPVPAVSSTNDLLKAGDKNKISIAVAKDNDKTNIAGSSANKNNGSVKNRKATNIHSTVSNKANVNINAVAANVEDADDEMILNEVAKTIAADPSLLAATDITMDKVVTKNITSGLDKAVTNSRNKTETAKATGLTREEKEWIENYAMYNRPAKKKWAGKLAWQLYATPSVVYRTLAYTGNTEPVVQGPYLPGLGTKPLIKDVTQSPSFGVEIGAGIKYDLLKRISIKTGLQMNYTRYNVLAYQNSHPVATTLTMHDYTFNTTYEEYKTSMYSNKSGSKEVSLHNATYQVSIPVGVDVKLIGNDKIQWNVGATIQPTFVFAGTSYLLSSDHKNYVKESAMINKFNLNAGFETFLSYKTNGYTWQIGPQFRKQLLSTNNKAYIISEKLLNYGVKIGVTKVIR